MHASTFWSILPTALGNGIQYYIIPVTGHKLHCLKLLSNMSLGIHDSASNASTIQGLAWLGHIHMATLYSFLVNNLDF